MSDAGRRRARQAIGAVASWLIDQGELERLSVRDAEALLAVSAWAPGYERYGQRFDYDSAAQRVEQFREFPTYEDVWALAGALADSLDAALEEVLPVRPLEEERITR